jgi:hypothetical protein
MDTRSGTPSSPPRLARLARPACLARHASKKVCAHSRINQAALGRETQASVEARFYVRRQKNGWQTPQEMENVPVSGL